MLCSYKTAAFNEMFCNFNGNCWSFCEITQFSTSADVIFNDGLILRSFWPFENGKDLTPTHRGRGKDFLHCQLKIQSKGVMYSRSKQKKNSYSVCRKHWKCYGVQLFSKTFLLALHWLKTICNERNETN